MIAITFALPAESSAFLSRVSGRKNITRDGITTIQGRVANTELEILHTGVGESICQRRMENFLQDQNAKLLISSGFAGAVTDDFSPGDLIIVENFSEPQLLSRARQLLHGQAVRTANLYTSPTMIDSRAERAAIAQTTGATALDMETKCIAEACFARGIAVLSLRAISDTPGEPLPAPANVLFDIERQQTPFLRLARYTVIDPAVIGRLFRFHRQIADARRTLADAITTVISKL